MLYTVKRTFGMFKIQFINFFKGHLWLVYKTLKTRKKKNRSYQVVFKAMLTAWGDFRFILYLYRKWTTDRTPFPCFYCIVNSQKKQTKILWWLIKVVKGYLTNQSPWNGFARIISKREGIHEIMWVNMSHKKCVPLIGHAVLKLCSVNFPKHS